MKRFAFKMYLKKGCEKEYAKRHAAIWPELKQMIKEQGVSDYSIFCDKETNLLFAVQWEMPSHWKNSSPWTRKKRMFGINSKHRYKGSPRAFHNVRGLILYS